MWPADDLAASDRRATDRREESGRKGDHLARPNHSYEKRRKELAKKQKKEQKRLRKLAKKEAQLTGGADQSPEAADPVGPVA